MQIPDGGLSFDPPLRVFNLSGGVSCLVAKSGLCWLMLPSEYGSFWNELTSSTYQISQIEGLRKLTFQIFKDANELQQNPFEQTFVDRLCKDGSLLDEGQIRRWMGLAVAYRNDSQPLRAMRAERISKQIRFCRSSVDKLHKAYRMCLSEKADNKNISNLKVGNFHFFSDDYALNIAYYVQPCLDSLFSLRDYIFTFLCEELYGEKTPMPKVISLLESDDKYGIANLVRESIHQHEPYGVIARTSSYRNAFFHYLGSSVGPLSEVYCLTGVETALGLIPRVTYPLDDNFERVQAIEKGRFQGYGDREEHRREAQRFMSSGNYVDALDLCFESLCALLDIAQRMAAGIPVKSQAMKLTEDEILEAVVIKDGIRQKYKRNAEGQLELIEEEEQ